MATKRIAERVSLPFAGSRVNRAAGTISNVLICGTTSLNNREYPVHVLRRDCAKYEGRPVNCDHGREATVDRRFGWFEDVKPGPDGRPRGTLHLLKSHPMYARVMEAAERNPSLYGFSHVAMCRTRPGTGGREVVEAIEHVESIDLVAEPATTRGLFEDRTMRTLNGGKPPTDGRLFAEWLSTPTGALDAKTFAEEVNRPDAGDLALRPLFTNGSGPPPSVSTAFPSRR